jgi:hypothetical protein
MISGSRRIRRRIGKISLGWRFCQRMKVLLGLDRVAQHDHQADDQQRQAQMARQGRQDGPGDACIKMPKADGDPAGDAPRGLAQDEGQARRGDEQPVSVSCRSRWRLAVTVCCA